MAYATATDVATRWGKDVSTLDPALVALINVRLDDVERLIERRFAAAVPARVLADDITNNVLNVADVVQVEAQAVLRLARNPEGYQSETDGDYTYMLAQGGDDGDCLDLTANEWYLLGLTNYGMFVIIPNPVLAT